MRKIWKIVQKTRNEINPHYESHWGTQNQMRLENCPQCATQWDSQNHMKRAYKARRTLIQKNQDLFSLKDNSNVKTNGSILLCIMREWKQLSLDIVTSWLSRLESPREFLGIAVCSLPNIKVIWIRSCSCIFSYSWFF